MNKVFGIGIIGIIVIGVGIFTLTNYSLDVAQTEMNDSEKTIRISTNLFPGLDHAFIAVENGYFEKYGVDVELILKPSYAENIECFNKGEVDGTLESLADAVLQKSFGDDVVVVYVADQSTNGDVIVSSVNDVSELKGKTIGIVGLNTFSHIFVSAIMEKYGLGYFDVYYENVDETNILNYLDSGKIHAGHTWEPTKTMVEQNGYNVIATAGDVPGIITDVLVFNSNFVNQHPNEIQSIVFAINDARDFVYSNPEEAITIMAKVEGLSFKDMSDAVNDADRPNSDKQKILFNPNSDDSLDDLAKQFLNFYKNTGILSDNPLFLDDDIIIDELFVDDFVNALGHS